MTSPMSDLQPYFPPAASPLVGPSGEPTAVIAERMRIEQSHELSAQQAPNRPNSGRRYAVERDARPGPE